MPDRIIRAGILSSDAVNGLTWSAEVFYRRLMSVVDDFGRFDGRTAVLRAQLYPLKLSNVSEPDVEKWLGECSRAALVRGYVVDKKPYVEIVKFDQRLRAKRSKWPPPSSDNKCGHPLSSADTFVSASDSESDSRKEGMGSGEREPEGQPLPSGFPATVKDAIAQCSTTAVTTEFVSQTWDKAFYRNGLDAKGVAINNFPAYVRTEWRYEQDRKGRETAYGPKSNRGSTGENPRNAGIIKGPTDYAAAFKRKAEESQKAQVAGSGAEPPGEQPPAANGPGGCNL